MAEFSTTKVSEVKKEDLKLKLDGPAFIERINYRLSVGHKQKKEAIAKGTILRRENLSSDTLQDHQKNPKFGFSCLHYSVSEAARAIRIKIVNKTKTACKVGVRTKDGEAQADHDYTPIHEIVTFKRGKKKTEVVVRILDDEGWEPDEDFFVELFDVET